MRISDWSSDVCSSDLGRVVPSVRAHGADKEIVCRILVAPTADADVARGVARRLIGTYLNVPVYRAFHADLGRDELEPMWKLWADGDRSAAVAAIPDHVVDELVVHGPPGVCSEHIARYVRSEEHTSELP